MPMGWSLGDLVDSQSMITITKSVSQVTMRLSIHDDFKWAVHINDNEFPFPCYSFPHFKDEKVSSVTRVLQLLRSADDSLCVGNPDSNFFQIRDQRKGQFLDQSSK